MNIGRLSKRMRSMRIVIVFLALLLAYGAVSYSLRAATSLPLYSVGLGGVTGATNNTVLAFGRFVLVAPFWPSKGVAGNGDLDLTQLDNSFIYVIDTKKPNSPPVSKELTVWDSKLGAAKTVYFPSRVVFDPQSKIVYVRGTRFEERDGEVAAIDVIAYVRLDLDDKGKPVFDTTVVPIDIQGVPPARYTGEAPLDFAFGSKGELMAFTNGASVFSYNLNHGYLFELPIVDPTRYGADDNISFLDVDPKTNIVSICENLKSVDKDNVATVSSAISFYRLREDGMFPLLKLVSADQFPSGTALSGGSNIVIVSEGDSEFALFATNDGSLWTVDLQDGPVPTTARWLYKFPELASDTGGPNPLLIQYDSEKRVIGVVKPGFTIEIRRPSNGRRANIRRPSNLLMASEPVLAMARLGKKNRVASASSFSEEFKSEGGLSNFVNGQNSQWLISTYSGNLYSVDVASDLPNSELRLLGQVGSRVNRIDYYEDRSSIVAINSFTLEDDGMRVASPGSLVVGKMSALQGQSSAVLQALLPTVSVLGRSAPSIRRPCNIKR